MTFKKLEILPIVLYEFQAPDNIYKETLDFMNSIDWTKLPPRYEDISYGITVNSGLQNNNNLNLFNSWVGEKVNEVKEDQNLMCDYLTCVNMWINCSFKDNWHHSHYHPLSYVSSIFYITGESGDTWFSRESEYFNKTIKLKQIENAQIIYKHKIKPKTLVIFPSDLVHSVSENKSFLPRTTISANYLPSGKVGEGVSMGYNFDIINKKFNLKQYNNKQQY
jgi:uncharacterized protein (TIGR02466 family)